MASGKKFSFDAAFKLSVIEDAESTTNRAAARVDERRIREWRQKRSDLSLLAPPSSKRRPRIVAASSRELKKLVAVASDRGNTVLQL